MIESGEGSSASPSTTTPEMPGSFKRKLMNFKAHVNVLRPPSSFLPEGSVSIPEDKIDPAKIADNATNWAYFLRVGTSGVRVLREQAENGEKSYEMPLWTRVKRKEILDEFKATPKEDVERRRRVLEKAHAVDEITMQYLKQENVNVDVPGLGELSSRYAILTPPESTVTPETKDLPSIFLVPALNADLFGDASLAMELALGGRKVVFAAQPESFMGKTTDEYRNAIKDSSSPEPHVAYFKELINQLIPDGQEFDLWGYSFGGSIAAGLLREKSIQERVKNAVLLCPAGVVDQKPFLSRNPLGSFGAGILHELYQDLIRQPHRKQNAALSAMVVPKEIGEDERNRERRIEIQKTMLQRMNRNLGMLSQAMQVKKGGMIMIVSGAEDDITRSYKIHDNFSNSSNPQIRSVIMQGASHHTPIVDSPRVIDFIANQQLTA